MAAPSGAVHQCHRGAQPEGEVFFSVSKSLLFLKKKKQKEFYHLHACQPSGTRASE
jgi:hypothetical protein